MKKLIYLVGLFVFSCANDSNVSRPKTKTTENVIIIKDKVEQKTLEQKTRTYNQSIFNYIDKWKDLLINKGFAALESTNTEKHKWPQFINENFVRISYDRQFDKGKNQIISFILYEYDNDVFAIDLFNELIYHENQDGIFKSGAFLIHHSKYLLQIVSTCSISYESWDLIRRELMFDLPYLYCVCGGMCTLEF